VLNEPTPTGDRIHSTGLTMNMIPVYLIDAISGSTTGNIVVGSAQSAASR
jgi:hypothetical protein